MQYIGIDPGYSGAIALLDDDGCLEYVKLKETMHSICDWIWEHTLEAPRTRCVIEQVNAMPKQGVSSSFKFGRSFGQAEAIVVCHKWPYKLVRPAKWQQMMCCRSKGDKNVTKAAAQRLFPGIKITHAIADSLLLAELARTKWDEL